MLVTVLMMKNMIQEDHVILTIILRRMFVQLSTRSRYYHYRIQVNIISLTHVSPDQSSPAVFTITPLSAAARNVANISSSLNLQTVQSVL